MESTIQSVDVSTNKRATSVPNIATHQGFGNSTPSTNTSANNNTSPSNSNPLSRGASVPNNITYIDVDDEDESDFTKWFKHQQKQIAEAKSQIRQSTPTPPLPPPPPPASSIQNNINTTNNNTTTSSNSNNNSTVTPTKQQPAQVSNPPVAEIPTCPICAKPLPGLSEVQITHHVDECLTRDYLDGETKTSTPVAKPSDNSSDPLSFFCPYPSCSKPNTPLSALEFCKHVYKNHRSDPFQHLFCPICKLLGEEPTNVVNNLNLWRHLNSIHGDLIATIATDYVPPHFGTHTSQFGTTNPQFGTPNPHFGTHDTFGTQPPVGSVFASKSEKKVTPIPVPSFTTNQFTHQFNFSQPPPPPVPTTTANKPAAAVPVFGGFGAPLFPPVANKPKTNNFLHYSRVNDVDDDDEEDEDEDEEQAEEEARAYSKRLSHAIPHNSRKPQQSRLPTRRVPIHTSISTNTPTPTTSTSTYTTTTTTADKHHDSLYIDYELEHDWSAECSICFEDFLRSQRLARMECMCVFHKDCLDKWFLKKRHCPLHSKDKE